MNEELTGGWSSALILGLLEGLTEFLPISSTGHLIVAAHALGESGRGVGLFQVVIQLGAIAAVCWHYRARLAGMARGLFGALLSELRDGRTGGASSGWMADPDVRLALQLFLAFLPAAALGLAFHSLIKEALFSPQVVAMALMAGGVVIILVERRPRAPRTTNLQHLRHRDALLIGLAQSLALVPGVSRAGATIIGGLLRGLDRRCAAEFSFLLALPTMVAAAGYDLYKNADLLNADLAAQIAGGFAAAFVAALLTVRALLAFVARHRFTPFGWYRIAFGALILLSPQLLAASS